MVLPYLACRTRAISPSFCVMPFHSLSTRPGKSRLVKLLVERKLPGEKAAVERGQREFQIVGIEAAGLLHRARAGTGAQPDVPHALDDGAHRSLATAPRSFRRQRQTARRCRNRGTDPCAHSRPAPAAPRSAGADPTKARRHISIRMRSTTADRRRIAAVPSPVRSQVWRTSAISRRYCSRRSSTCKTIGFIGLFA